MLESNMTPTRMQRYRKYRCKLPFLTTLSFYTGCLFYRRDSFSKYFARILKRQENDRSLNSKKNSVCVCESSYHVQNGIYNMQGLCNALAQNGPKQGKNLKTFKRKREIVKAAQSLSIDQKHLSQLVFFLTFVKNAIQVCMCILSYPSVLTPKKRKTRLAGKTRTYLWACPLTPIPVMKIQSGLTQVAYCVEKSVLVLFT